MELYVDHLRRLVTVWLPNDEKDAAILEPLYRKYKNTPYHVVVLRSGMGDLISNTSALLRSNRG